MITLEKLPPAPNKESGWPWDQTSPILPKIMANGSDWPRISIVTPSYNQGEFIEETIRSVLLQGYPNLEYIIIDGGSTDNTIDIIKKYEQYISYWVSEPDGGQSDALNKGFRKATGDLIGWQNSDDYYHCCSFLFAAQASILFPDTDVLYGSVERVDEEGNVIQSGQAASDFDPKKMLPWANMFNQSMFFRRRIFDEDNWIDETYHHFMDYNFFWRLILKSYKFSYIPVINGYFRHHANSKGFYQRNIVNKEYLRICNFIYNQKELPNDVREKAAICFRDYCLDYYGKLDIPSFQKGILELIKMSGLKTVNLGLLSRLALSFVGKKNLEKIRRLKK